MSGLPIITAISVVLVAGAVAAIAAPWIAADMRRAVRREDRTPPDITMIMMMGFGPGLWVGVAGVAVWLGRTWA
ncbi:hypothetical protein [Methylobacterium sp.]|uniref:hypothetical protein n=1 Tax=Methylobacterium sp. TaxID=409 RepID=UPI0025D1E77F|nr:hypothetical protein [Methylobacterium sp.]MBY0256925.1 hypothetical protein [Methylobacterium sp.]